MQVTTTTKNQCKFRREKEKKHVLFSSKWVHSGETFLTGGKIPQATQKGIRTNSKEESIGFILPFPDQTPNNIDNLEHLKGIPRGYPF